MGVKNCVPFTKNMVLFWDKVFANFLCTFWIYIFGILFATIQWVTKKKCTYNHIVNKSTYKSKKKVGQFLEFFSFSHEKLHCFSRFSREIKNREKWHAYWLHCIPKNLFHMHQMFRLKSVKLSLIHKRVFIEKNIICVRMGMIVTIVFY